MAVLKWFFMESGCVGLPGEPADANTAHGLCRFSKSDGLAGAEQTQLNGGRLGFDSILHTP